MIKIYNFKFLISIGLIILIYFFNKIFVVCSYIMLYIYVLMFFVILSSIVLF